MKIEKANLFENLPADMSAESFEVIAAEGATRIERIVSLGQASPPQFWYDQDQNEWVLLLRGAARLEFEHRPGFIALGPGDCVNIPAGARHRVAWTDPDQPTVWVAVFFEGK